MSKSTADDLLSRFQGQEMRIAHMRGQLAAYQRIVVMQGEILSQRGGCGRTAVSPDEFVVPDRSRSGVSVDPEEPRSCDLPDAGTVSTDGGLVTVDTPDATVRRRPNTP